MSAYHTQPPPLSFTTANGGTIPSTAAVIPNNNPSPSPSPTSSTMIVIIIIASAIVASTSIYLLLRLLSCRHHRTYATSDDTENHISGQIFDSLPLFSFSSVTATLTSADCAVCLSKFEPHDKLRLLPLCCHAFHRDCIDTWLVTNSTCPLCRSTLNATDEDVLNKVLEASIYSNATRNNSNSFRLEIGSVSRARVGSESGRRSYSIGSSFEYVVEESHEVPAELCNGKDLTGVPVPELMGDSLTRDVVEGRSWLRDYVDRISSMSLSSRALSFRSSGRFCSSRGSDVVVPVDDLEVGRTGEEISELFRWLSGV